MSSITVTIRQQINVIYDLTIYESLLKVLPVLFPFVVSFRQIAKSAKTSVPMYESDKRPS